GKGRGGGGRGRGWFEGCGRRGRGEPMWNPPRTTTSPTPRKTTIVVTLSSAAQNSNSPNAAADKRFTVSTTASAMRTVCQVGRVGNQYCTYSPTAESSAMPVSAQSSQYIHPVA